MTRFLDGPAKGQVLMLRRSPVYLRVTRDPAGKFDALDQLNDSPRKDEDLFAYVLKAKPGGAFIDGPKCRGFYPVAEYSMALNPPGDDVMRNDLRWAAWCEARGLPDHLKT